MYHIIIHIAIFEPRYINYLKNISVCPLHERIIYGILKTRITTIYGRKFAEYVKLIVRRKSGILQISYDIILEFYKS